MNTILTDDELPKLPMPRIVRGTNPHCYSDLDMEAYADAREAAVLAKLARRNSRPVAEVIHARVEKMTPDQLAAYESARKKFKLAQQADRQRVPGPTNNYHQLREALIFADQAMAESGLLACHAVRIQISVGTKMATEKELGYEPSLLIEMVMDRTDGRVSNVAVIQKDRSDTINGREFPMPTYESFAPHFKALNIGGQHFDSMDAKDSQAMFPDANESGWDMEARRRTILCEEITELMKKHYPAQSVEDKQKRADLLEMHFDTRSWTKVEGMSSEVLKLGLEAMRERLEPPPVDEAKPASAEAA